MKKSVNKFMICAGILIILLVGVNWQYPYSSFSFNKTVTYKADPIFLDGYKQDLDEFKEFHKDQSKDRDPLDVTTDWTQYILQMYEQPWLLDKKTSKVKYEDLDRILHEVKSVRGTLIDLAFREEYEEVTRSYLKLTLEDILYIEESIEMLKNSKTNSRRTLIRQLRNLHVEFVSNFDHFSTFYKQYTGDR